MGLLDTIRRALTTAPAPPLSSPSSTTSRAAFDANPIAVAQLENDLRATQANPARANYWSGRRVYGDLECQMLGRNGLARRALMLRAFDATRAGWTVRFRSGTLEPEQAQETNARLRAQQKRLNATAKLRLAMARGEQYGHALIVVGVDDGSDNLAAPLILDNVRRVLWLKVFARPDYILGDLSAADSENFGLPEWYDINDFEKPEVEAFNVAPRTGHKATMRRVHHSRILGPFRTEDGHSRLDELGQAIEDYLATQTSASSIVDTFSTAVFKIAGFLGKLGQNADATKGRIGLAQTAKNLIGAMVLDKENESFEYQNRSITGLPDLIEGKAAQLSAFSGIPPMLLLGADPRGFSTGDEITDQYNNTVQAEQVDKLESPLRRLIDILLRSEDGPQIDVKPEDWTIAFNPLRSPTSEEIAKIRSILWGAASALVDKGLITRGEFRDSFFRDGFEVAPTITLSEEGDQTEGQMLLVGQAQALTALILAAYPEGAPATVYNAALEGGFPSLTPVKDKIFPPEAGVLGGTGEGGPSVSGPRWQIKRPDTATEEPQQGDALTDDEVRRERWLSASQIAEQFGSITGAQIRRKRASQPRTHEPGRLDWIKPGRDPLYRLSQIEALVGFARPDLEEGTSDDPADPSSRHNQGDADDPDQTF